MKRLWVHFNEWFMLLILGGFTAGLIGILKCQGFLYWISLAVLVSVVSFLLLQLSLSVYYEKIHPEEE